MSKSRKFIAAISTLATIITLTGCGPSPEQAFNNCLLKHQSANTSTKEACAEKYQKRLPKSAVRRISGNAGFNGLGWFAIRIKNKNENWIITKIQYHIRKNEFALPSNHRKNIIINPLHEQTFTPDISDHPTKKDTNFHWGIDKAWGIPTSD